VAFWIFHIKRDTISLAMRDLCGGLPELGAGVRVIEPTDAHRLKLRQSRSSTLSALIESEMRFPVVDMTNAVVSSTRRTVCRAIAAPRRSRHCSIWRARCVAI